MATTPTTIDEYVAAFPPSVQTILEKIRATVAEAAPDARERISYRMPAFEENGILLYFAAFKNHIGIYPPVSGDRSLEKALAPYTGPKGNLRFPLDRPMPYHLIRRMTTLRVKQNLARAAGRAQKPRVTRKALSRRSLKAAARPAKRRGPG
ncbi:MAG: hypothetical protein EHM13_01495 [Acidobacteria bacterium]|nr:MAG: hypothetical protein EHM13_01495 [Acidobacteriota bacterium]